MMATAPFRRPSPRRLCPAHLHLHSDRDHQQVFDASTCDVCRLSGFATGDLGAPIAAAPEKQPASAA